MVFGEISLIFSEISLTFRHDNKRIASKIPLVLANERDIPLDRSRFIDSEIHLAV